MSAASQSSDAAPAPAGTASASAGVDAPPLGPLIQAIGDPVRWEMLRTLSHGEPRMVVEIAEALGRPATLISKHIAWLLKAGAVERNRAGLYAIPRRFLPSPGDGTVDFGHCLLRLPSAG